MSDTPKYEYTAAHVTAAFNEIKSTLFEGITAEDVPKMLVVAGLQGSGKTYLLEKNLLPSKSYDNYVRLYLPEYRKKHPEYTEISKKGVLYAYEHTEAFVRELSTKVFVEAFSSKYNIIMESAFDSIDFATFPPSATAAGYQFEIHIVVCLKEFAHVSSIKRAFKSLKEEEMERFLTVSALDASMSNAQAIILALEVAAKTVSGSTITLYERGFGELKERTQRAKSLYTKNTDGTLTITPTETAFSHGAYQEIINNHVYSTDERDEMVKECHLSLLKTATYDTLVPDHVYNDLYAYIIKYVYQ